MAVRQITINSSTIDSEATADWQYQRPSSDFTQPTRRWCGGYVTGSTFFQWIMFAVNSTLKSGTVLAPYMQFRPSMAPKSYDFRCRKVRSFLSLIGSYHGCVFLPSIIGDLRVFFGTVLEKFLKNICRCTQMWFQPRCLHGVASLVLCWITAVMAISYLIRTAIQLYGGIKKKPRKASDLSLHLLTR